MHSLNPLYYSLSLLLWPLEFNPEIISHNLYFVRLWVRMRVRARVKA